MWIKILYYALAISYSGIEYYLGKTNKIKANSVIQLLINLFTKDKE
jgi:hypothetical protein